MVDKLKVAVISAVRAYMETEERMGQGYPDRVLSEWRMRGRREITDRFNIPRGGNSSRVAFRGYSFL
ncbi:MAG: hypothetical protein U5O15_05855 [Candidatus Krumholzibacteriota bacterium]|nr:hypothetical protein [Candidatus Krumholzibacteriota bacterium]